MKKIVTLILALACAFALFSCGGEDTVQLAIDDVKEMYNAISPSKVVTTSTQTFGEYTLEASSTLKTGFIDGFAVSVYDYSYQQLRDIESGSGNVILDPIETISGSWAYHEDLGYRENDGKWGFEGEDFTPETGAIALNITKETVKDFVSDAETKTITFKVASENTESVFGYEIPAEVSVEIVHSGADITSVSISYTLENEDNDDHPEIAVNIKAEYSYDSQIITLD